MLLKERRVHTQKVSDKIVSTLLPEDVRTVESQISHVWAIITAITLFNSSSRWRQTTVSGHQPSLIHMKAAAIYF